MSESVRVGLGAKRMTYSQLEEELTQAEALLDECESYLDFTVSVYVGDDKALDLLTKLKQQKEKQHEHTTTSTRHEG